MLVSYSINIKNVCRALWDTQVIQQGEMVSGKASGTEVREAATVSKSRFWAIEGHETLICFGGNTVQKVGACATG